MNELNVNVDLFQWSSGERNSAVDVPLKVLDNVLRSLKCTSDAVRQYPAKIIGCEENSRAVFPLGFGHATNYIGHGVALVGYFEICLSFGFCFMENCYF